MQSPHLMVCLALMASWSFASSEQVLPVWSFECRNNHCVKVAATSAPQPLSYGLPVVTTAVSRSVCQLLCGTNPGTVWPRISGRVRLDQHLVASINPKAVTLCASNTDKHANFWSDNKERFVGQLDNKLPRAVRRHPGHLDDGQALSIKVEVKQLVDRVSTEVDESYSLDGSEALGKVSVLIRAETIFGARHGLETLAQLVVFDDVRRLLVIPANFSIEDRPAFKHRGLLLDTARNYFSVESIKTTIDGMAMTKLNTFHWHITDSQSFPLILKSHPDLAQLGAYSPDKVYTADDVSEILDYAHIRGVRVLPEFDAPAHVGEGWQRQNLTVCFNEQPWQNYCVEPPCGQLDPTQDRLYTVLQDIYREMLQMFRQPTVFHMGGDEVSTACWNTSAEVRDWMTRRGWTEHTEADFMRLWGHFQSNALLKLDELSAHKLDVILWTSRLTDVPFVDDFLDKARYIIQIWTTGADTKITDLLQRGYKLIMSNYDALYFDCGYGSWVGEGNNWCSPYIGWQKVYNNDWRQIAGDRRAQILGAEATLWSEQADEQVLDGRFWPRASALAERLWTDPETDWRAAEARMLAHRERLVENGIRAESLQPEWCAENEGQCPLI